MASWRWPGGVSSGAAAGGTGRQGPVSRRGHARQRPASTAAVPALNAGVANWGSGWVGRLCREKRRRAPRVHPNVRCSACGGCARSRVWVRVERAWRGRRRSRVWPRRAGGARGNGFERCSPVSSHSGARGGRRVRALCTRAPCRKLGIDAGARCARPRAQSSKSTKLVAAPARGAWLGAACGGTHARWAAAAAAAAMPVRGAAGGMGYQKWLLPPVLADGAAGAAVKSAMGRGSLLKHGQPALCGRREQTSGQAQGWASAAGAGKARASGRAGEASGWREQQTNLGSANKCRQSSAKQPWGHPPRGRASVQKGPP